MWWFLNQFLVVVVHFPGEEGFAAGLISLCGNSIKMQNFCYLINIECVFFELFCDESYLTQHFPCVFHVKRFLYKFTTIPLKQLWIYSSLFFLNTEDHTKKTYQIMSSKINEGPTMASKVQNGVVIFKFFFLEI
jgi:hypothetical protein